MPRSVWERDFHFRRSRARWLGTDALVQTHLRNLVLVVFLGSGGLDALEDRRPAPHRVWNRIPDDVRERSVALALDEPDLSPREVAVAFTDRELGLWTARSKRTSA